jgi:hypothetical protein
MSGRVRRKQLAAVTGQVAVVPPPETCALCDRPLGRRIEWHHVLPKSEGGRETVALHPICHRTIHASASNVELARLYPTIDALRQRDDIRRFVVWIADKPPDFHAPTRRKQG